MYAVIAYYLAHRDTIDAYVRQRDAEATAILADLDARRTPDARALRSRLRAFRDAQKP